MTLNSSEISEQMGTIWQHAKFEISNFCKVRITLTDKKFCWLFFRVCLQIDLGLVWSVKTMPEYGIFGGLKGFFGLGCKNEVFKPNISFASFKFLRFGSFPLCIQSVSDSVTYPSLFTCVKLKG